MHQVPEFFLKLTFIHVKNQFQEKSGTSHRETLEHLIIQFTLYHLSALVTYGRL